MLVFQMKPHPYLDLAPLEQHALLLEEEERTKFLQENPDVQAPLIDLGLVVVGYQNKDGKLNPLIGTTEIGEKVRQFIQVIDMSRKERREGHNYDLGTDVDRTMFSDLRRDAMLLQLDIERTKAPVVKVKRLYQVG